MIAKLSAAFALALFTVPFFTGCSSATDEQAATGDDDEGTVGAEEALGSGGHYCPEPYTGGHSSSPAYMYSGAHAAMEAAGVGDSQLIQTFGDAPASVGTHCPEPGVKYSDATDINPGAHACDRVHDLRMHGFAAWYRVPAEGFGYHIHAVYAGAPVMKSSLKNQVASFLVKRNGLVSNTIEKYCPITSAEVAAVKAVKEGHAGTSCSPGGFYCGGDKVSGDSRTLYKCNSSGTGASEVEVCARGCKVNPGEDDACRTCVPGGEYCGGDHVSGNANNLYRCNDDGAPTLVKACKNGCSVNPGSDDSCK
ncbi:MAG TPA: hypothetical protein VF407_12575 [Polyangiaceae bacterium]